MVFRFRVHQVRAQVVNAQNEFRQDVADTSTSLHQQHIADSPREPSLVLIRKGNLIFLAPAGSPVNSAKAYAIGFGAVEAIQTHHPRDDWAAPAGDIQAQSGNALDVDDDIGPHDFAETIPVAAFEKALHRTEIAIVVRRTYINVLGGQPSRTPTCPTGPSTVRGRQRSH